MYGMNFSGGANKTHGQVERAERIDSFEAGKVEGWDVLFTNSMVPLECGHFTEDDEEVVELSRGQWSTTLELTRTPSGFGGSCAYWLCPRCGKRARYLYFKNRDFLCRGCAKLNYRCQQRTKDSTNYARDGLKLAREKLHWEPPFPVVPAEFPCVVPDRPRYMHKRTYYHYLARYRRYQEKYQRDSMREMLAILRRWGRVFPKIGENGGIKMEAKVHQKYPRIFGARLHEISCLSKGGGQICSPLGHTKFGMGVRQICRRTSPCVASVCPAWNPAMTSSTMSG